MANPNLETLLIIFVAITGFSVLMQAFVLLGIFLAVRKAVQNGKEQADEFRAKLMPVLEGAKEFMGAANGVFAASKKLLDGLDPKLNSAAAELELMTKGLHDEANRLRGSADAINEKVLRQADRVDGMTTSFLDGVERVGGLINEAFNVPVRQISGLVAAAKAVLETLRAPGPPRPRRASPATRATDDKDLFV